MRVCSRMLVAGAATGLLSGLLLVPPAALAADSGSVADIRDRLIALQQKVSDAEEKVQVGERSLRTTGRELTTDRTALANAAQVVRGAHHRTTAAARMARIKSSAATRADRRAAVARAEVQQLTRSAYMGAMASSELLLLTEFITDGSASLGDFAQQDLAVGRVQYRLLDESDAAAAAATDARMEADVARDDHEAALSDERSARAALASARSDLDATVADLKQQRRQLTKSEDVAEELAQRYDRAYENYREAVLAACAAGGTWADSAPPASTGSRAKDVWDILIANGFSEEAAAGVLGNLQQESNVDPTAMQSGGPGRGLAQWSAGGRWDSGSNSLLAFAGTRGMDPWDVKTQTLFMIYEMSQSWFDLAKFQQMDDIDEATLYFHDVYERSADSASFVTSVRAGYAKGWYLALAGSEPDAGSAGLREPIISCE